MSGPRRLAIHSDHATQAGGVVAKAAPRVQLGTRYRATLDRIAMKVANHFRAGLIPVDIAVEVAVLPELLAIDLEFAGSDLLEGLQKLRHKDRGRLAAIHNPSFAHSASTLALVARSISIIAGQGRSKPSAFHFRVASMPIFDP